MGAAKDILVRPIAQADANRLVRAIHYSHKVVRNSQVHLGVFLGGVCGGALQFGPSLDKRHTIGLVRETQWNEFIELNRLALADWLPRNSESRAIGYAMRWLKRTYPWLKWVLSFADGTQCGDGTIYRASGFVLTGLRANSTIFRFPDGEVVADLGIKTGYAFQRRKFGRVIYGQDVIREARRLGAHLLRGYQLRYIYFLDPSARARLTVPELPFSAIAGSGATMYRGQRPAGVESIDSDAPGHQSGEGGAHPTSTLHPSEDR